MRSRHEDMGLLVAHLRSGVSTGQDKSRMYFIPGPSYIEQIEGPAMLALFIFFLDWQSVFDQY